MSGKCTIFFWGSSFVHSLNLVLQFILSIAEVHRQGSCFFLGFCLLNKTPTLMVKDGVFLLLLQFSNFGEQEINDCVLLAFQ